MTEALSMALNGLTLMSILMLVALGLAIIYGLMGIINLAHGEFVTIGAYTLFTVQALGGSCALDTLILETLFWISVFVFTSSGVFLTIKSYSAVSCNGCKNGQNWCWVLAQRSWFLTKQVSV